MKRILLIAGDFVEDAGLALPDAVTDGNFVTGPAWTAHVEWLKQFTVLLNR